MIVRDEEIQNMAFKTRYGHYKFVMIPFRLTNTPVAFTGLMNWVYMLMLECM